MDTSSPFPDMSQLSSDLYRQWERAMGSWWEQVVDSPAFLGALGGQAGRMAQSRGAYEDAVDQGMERVHLPSRKDIIRLTRVATLLEERLLSQEDLLLALKDRIDGLERELLAARVEAAEARLELRESLAALPDQLAGKAESAPRARRPKADR